MTAGFPAAAERLVGASPRLADRALEIAFAADPSLLERHGQDGLRLLLRDTQVFIDRLGLSLASGDPSFARDWADQVAVLYRRRQVPMDDLIAIAEGLRKASETVVAAAERAPLDDAIDEAVRIFGAYRRIAGDARKRSRLLRLIYKGA
jgi:hypothetical protein